MSCLPTGKSFLTNNLDDLRYFYNKGPRLPSDNCMDLLENLGRCITVIPAHAITAVFFAPIAFVYDLAIALICGQGAAYSMYMDQQFELYCESSFSDVGYMVQHAFAAIFPCCVYQVINSLN
jgi:hypothetical protein